MNKKIDFDRARQILSVPQHMRGISCDAFTEYTPAYVLTNDDLYGGKYLQDIENARVLTTAGSGDHPIFYAINGAKHVDTFDISYCTRAIMDVKTTAFQVLDYILFIHLICGLYRAPKISAVKNFSRIQGNLPTDTRNFINELDEYKIFSNGLAPLKYYAEYLPTMDEYARMQKIIKEPFNFIWADLVTVHEHLDMEYDIINFSNIFQYIRDRKKRVQILESLRPFLAKDGIIMVENEGWFKNSELQEYRKIEDVIKSWGKMGFFKTGRQDTFALKKIK